MSSHNLLSKRKHDDHDPNDNALTPPTPKMRKDKGKEHPQLTSLASTSSPSPMVHFFVKMMGGKTLVLHSHVDDTVEFLHERIQSITGVPVCEQRLICNGRQLQSEKLISECGIVNDVTLHLVGRMRSTDHPKAWQVIDDMASLIFRLCKGEISPVGALKSILSNIDEYIQVTTAKGAASSPIPLQIFQSSCIPAALVMLYLSPRGGNHECGDAAIRHLIFSCRCELLKTMPEHCAPIILEFCKLLGRAGHDRDPLYLLCRSSLGSMVGSVSLVDEPVRIGLRFIDAFQFVTETGMRLSHDLEGEMGVLSHADVQDFAAFSVTVCNAIRKHKNMIEVPDEGNVVICREEIKYLHEIFNGLLEKMEVCLRRVEQTVALKEKEGVAVGQLGWCHYLLILKQLYNISKCYVGAEDQFWTKMKNWKVPINHLIVMYTTRDEDHTWLMMHKEVTEFESRRHLVMMMLPEMSNDYEELFEMLIDRSQLLSESFEYIGHADVNALKRGLFIEFKNEEATGPGVLREWFFMVCQQIFNQENALFVACPNDRRRFFPNQVSKVHTSGIGLEYFDFAGRVIALALIHKLQVGIVFDRVFFLQLAGNNVSLEDIRDADPFMYNSCKKILELDSGVVDSDILGLTFVREVEELGAKTTVELCPDGKNIAVNSRNRQEYVDRLIQHRFVYSIKDQVQRFAKGFADMLCIPDLQHLFFQSLELQDLDWMLRGSEVDISVEDWKAHTEYKGFKESDLQMTWFWKIVEAMTSEQKKVLLFFWTSLKFLPVEGFRGLSSRLYIYKSSDTLDRLPSSHTCFYRICFPPYPSTEIMQERLNIVTQEHVSCSFGTY